MDIRKIDLNLLVVLDVLLEELHISRSAKRLNLSQPAVSRALAKLRVVFDDPIIVRISNGYQRTSRGEELANSVKALLIEIEATLTQPEFDPKYYQKEFAVCTLDYGEAVLLPGIMERLLAEAPGISIRIVHRRIYSISEVLDGTADILLGTIPDNPPKHCAVQSLYDDRFVCVMRKDHPLRNGRLNIEDYTRFPHSIIHTGESPGTSIDLQMEKLGFSRKIVKRSPHFVASLMSIRNSDLLQTVPEKLALAVLNPNDFIIKELPIPTEPVGIGQMWHGRHNKDPAHMWFRQLIADFAQQV